MALFNLIRRDAQNAELALVRVDATGAEIAYAAGTGGDYNGTIKLALGVAGSDGNYHDIAVREYDICVLVSGVPTAKKVLLVGCVPY